MAKSKPKTGSKAADSPIPPATIALPGGPATETTGRYIVIFKEDATDNAAIRTMFNDVAGLKDVRSSSDFLESESAAEELSSEGTTHFESLGIAIVDGLDAAVELATAAADVDSPILAVEPEYLCYPSSLGSGSWDYLRGYRDAVNQLYESLAALGESEDSADASNRLAVFANTAQFTWGLQATGVHTSRWTGRGIRVAVLDTGFDVPHPDYRGREIFTAAFVAGAPIQDINGHGTHCIGTACGSQRPASGVRRYGVAHAATIFAGKVFNNNPNPSAPTGAILAGLEWAITNGCQVVSLSLGATINQQIQQYATPVRRALAAGTLVVAAAGNNANRRGLPGFDPRRPATFGFVEPPANADQAMAVAALDSRSRIAVFSARSSLQTGEGGKVNIAGPGVDVFSSFPIALGTHGSISGTSMATPHVAGIAALWAEATGERGQALWNRLLQSALPLTLSSADVGAGLVQAPQ